MYTIFFPTFFVLFTILSLSRFQSCIDVCKSRGIQRIEWGFLSSYAAAHLVIPNGQRSGVASNLTVSEYENKEELLGLYMYYYSGFLFSKIEVVP